MFDRIDNRIQEDRHRVTRLEDTNRADEVDLRAYRKGDLVALDRLIERYRPMLYAYALTLTGTPTEADDLFQDTWVRVIRWPHRFRGGSFRNWLLRIAHNAGIDRIRRRKPTASLDQTPEQGVAWVDTLPDPAPDAASQVASEDAHQHLWRAIAGLPEAQREVFVLRVEAELSFKEIAELLEVPLNTALGRMHYAVRRLQRLLRKEPDDDA